MNKEKSREDLIKQCRYYKGQEVNPFTDSEIAWFWDMERVYVKNNGIFRGEEGYYMAIGGKKYKGIPFYLLMTLFTGWGKYTEDMKAHINDFYTLIDEYLDFVSDEIPRNKIPNC
jgi:hypothetical protein